MYDSRKSKRQAERLQKKRMKQAIVAAALALNVAGAAMAPAALAVTAEQSLNVSQGIVKANTIKKINLENLNGNIGFLADVFRQEGSNLSIASEVTAKTYTPEAPTEKQALADAEAKVAQHAPILKSANEILNLWMPSVHIDYPAGQETEFKVTFSDGSVRWYPSMEAIETARESAIAAADRETAEADRLTSAVRTAEAALAAATAEREDLSQFTLTYTARNSTFSSNVWESEEGIDYKVGDVLPFTFNGITGNATVISNSEAGVLTLDVVLPEALTAKPATRVTYTDVKAPVAPGKAVNDTITSVAGKTGGFDLTANDIATEGESIVEGSVRLINPETGERVSKYTNDLGTFDTQYSNKLFITSDKAFSDFKIDYEFTDTANNIYRATATISHTPQEGFKQTVPTDVSTLDTSNPDNNYTVIRNLTSFINKDAVKQGRYNQTYGLISAPAPTALDDIATLPVNTKAAFDTLAKANVGKPIVDNFGFDPKAQATVAEDASLQAVIDATGETVSMGESVHIDGVGTVSVVPSTGTQDIVPVDYVDGKAVAAQNKYDRPYITFAPEDGYVGEVPAITSRWKTVAYGKKTADIKAFWANYDATGAGSELVGQSKIHILYTAPDMTTAAATGRAAAMNPAKVAPSATFNPANYINFGTTAGGGYKAPLIGYGAKDAVQVMADTAVSVDVTKNDTTAGAAVNTDTSYVGGSYSGQKEYGFKAADGTLVKELAVPGGKWVLTEIIDYANGSWSAIAYARFIGETASTPAPAVTWVNKNLDRTAEGITLTAKSEAPKYAYVASTLRLIDADGNLVENLTDSKVGTWTVNKETAKVDFAPVAGYKGTATVKYSIVDRWVGSEADQASPLYPYAQKLYGAEIIGTVAVTVDDVVPVEPELPPVEEVPTPTIPEIPPVEVTPEEPTLPELPPVEVTPEDPTLPEIPPVEETPEETPEKTPEETPTPEEEIPTPDLSTTPDEPTPSEEPTPEITTIKQEVPDSSTTVQISTEDESDGAEAPAEEDVDLAYTGQSMEALLLALGFSASLGAVGVHMIRMGRKAKATV